VAFDEVGFTQYASSGVLLEGDVGARLGRNYNLFLLWERAQLGDGRAEANDHGGQRGADSDFWALGIRGSSDADRVGLLIEIAIGYRRLRALWADGTELQFTNAPFEARFGVGADIRLNPLFAISPLATFGVGSFGTIRRVHPDGTTSAETGPLDEPAGHGWFTLSLGGHFDLAGSTK
jgi:hypothetical protein